MSEESLCRAEFLVEPFNEGRPGPHVRAAIEAVERHGLTTELGPFATTVSGPCEALTGALEEMIEVALAAGASKVTVNLVAEPGR